MQAYCGLVSVVFCSCIRQFRLSYTSETAGALAEGVRWWRLSGFVRCQGLAIIREQVKHGTHSKSRTEGTVNQD